ncbi:MAG: methyltransferase domain-containing protein [Chloracidobacterium sp.]|nr:methyltransferase domain-containing protein [Chloracidobacterium sp.]
MKSDTISMLRDPNTLEPLQPITGSDNESLINPRTGRIFPAPDGIPVFLDDSNVNGFNRKFKKFYDLCAPIYDEMIKSYLFVRRLGNDEQMRAEYLRELEIKEGARVLEVSIGTGSNIRYLPRNCSYYGLDISWGMLKRCQKNLRKWGCDAELFHGCAEFLPFADESFDVVFHAGGIKFFNDKSRAIREMIRVSKPGTKILIMDQAEKIAEDVLKVPVAKQFFKGLKEMTVAPTDLVPGEMLEKKIDSILQGGCYCLQFRKPTGANEARRSSAAGD